MTKLIKFRAWLEGEMVQVQRVTLFDSVYCCMNEKTGYEYNLDKKEHLMQYTGLSDKNGVDIYEGDVVKDKANRHFEVGYCFSYKQSDDRKKFARYEMKCIRQSEVNNYKFTKVGDIVEFSDWMYPVVDIEVVGNIYENKELLK